MQHAKTHRARRLCIMTLSLFCVSIALHASSAADDSRKERQTSANEPTRDAWRERMWATETPATGCFRTAYPDMTWHEVPCKPPSPQPFSSLARGPAGTSPAAGGPQGYILRAPLSAHLAKVTGSFPSVTGVTSVSTEGGGTNGWGPNQYSLQISSNAGSTAACGDRPNCAVWQQFVYSTRFPFQDSGPVLLMDTWLFNYGRPCPTGWWDFYPDCQKPTGQHAAPLIPITDLAKVQLTGTADKNGKRQAILQYGDELYTVSDDASILNIADMWTDAEFNVYGNGGGSEAVFNPGSSLTVKATALYDNLQLSIYAPKCVTSDNAMTGETNNLNLGNCIAGGYPASDYPYVQFTESN